MATGHRKAGSIRGRVHEPVDTEFYDRVPGSALADPARAREVLDRTLSGVRRDLSRLLQRALAAEEDKRGIVFIERLEFEALISAEWSEDDIAREIGPAGTAQPVGKVSDRETTRFADEAEHLARFLLDVAEGAGFTRDWHRSFDGLKPLSRTLRSSER